MVLGFNLISSVFTRAEDEIPRDVTVLEISQNSAKIQYSTAQDTQGVIEYGTSPTALNFYAPETQRTKDHSINLTLLSPNSSYYFQIKIGEKKYDNGGVPWTFSTKTIERTQPSVQGASTQLLLTPTARPTPIQSIIVPNDGEPNVATPSAPLICVETDCKKICQSYKDGKGCEASDFTKAGCIGKVDWNTCTDKTTPIPTPL
ncbi:MAG: fibronectin type III domain-containing protein [bacterium]